MGQTLSAARFYVYGRRHCTKSGYRGDPKITAALEGTSLSGKVFICTGSSSGIGKELARFLYQKGARVFMFCRNLEKAEQCKRDIEASDLIQVLGVESAVESRVGRSLLNL